MKRALFILFTLSQVNFSVLAQEVNWARHFDPESDRHAELTAVTTSGEFTFAFGHTRYPIAIDYPNSEEKLPPGFFLVKLDGEGNTVWKQSIETDVNHWNTFILALDQKHDIAVGSDGKIYVAGAISGKLTFPGVSGPYTFDIFDYSVNEFGYELRVLPFLARFNASGELEDLKIIAKVAPEVLRNRDIPYLDMMMDDDHIYIAARYDYSIIQDPGTVSEQVLNSYTEGSYWQDGETFFIARYNTDFELTDIIDVRQPVDSRNKISTVSFVKAENGIHVLTSFSGIMVVNQDHAPFNIYSGPDDRSGSLAGALIQFDEQGDYVRHEAFLQTLSRAHGNSFYDLSMDKNGNVYVAGTVRTFSSIGTGEDRFEVGGAAANYPVLIKFDADYNFQWIRAFIGIGNEGILGDSGVEGRFVSCLESGCALGGDTGKDFRIIDLNKDEVLFDGNANGNATPFLILFDDHGEITQLLLMETKVNHTEFGLDGVTKFSGFYAASDTNIVAAGRFTGEMTIGAGLESAITLVEPEQSVVFLRDLFVTSLDMSVYEPPAVTLSIDRTEIAENGGVATVTVSLSDVSRRTITVGLSLDGTASGDDIDYSLSDHNLLIPAGSQTATAIITAVDDLINEGDENIVVTIDRVTNGTFDGAPLTITISDDDQVVVSIDEDQLASKLKLRPNPAQSLLHIDLPTSSTPWTQVAIANSNGTSELTAIPLAGEKQMTLDVSQLRSGIYILLVQNEEVLLRKKVMIAR